MKKITIIMLTLSIIAFTACNSENNVEGLSENNTGIVSDSVMQQVQRNAELVQLQNSILCFNTSFFPQQQSPETRNIWKSLKKVLKVIVTVAADAVGGVVGGVAGGVTASGIVGGALAFEVSNIAVTPMYAATRTTDVFLRDSIFNRSDIVFSNVVPININVTNDSIGYYHNKVLYSMFSTSTKLQNFANLDKQEQAQAIVAEMSKEPYIKAYYGDELNNTANVNMGISTAEAVMKIAEEAETEDEFFDRLAEIGLTDTNVIAVMKEILSGLSNINPETDNGQYYQEVLKIIDNSSLDNEMKLRLSDGVIIGQASNHLWKLKPIQNVNDNLRDFGNGQISSDLIK